MKGEWVPWTDVPCPARPGGPSVSRLYWCYLGVTWHGQALTNMMGNSHSRNVMPPWAWKSILPVPSLLCLYVTNMDTLREVAIEWLCTHLHKLVFIFLPLSSHAFEKARRTVLCILWGIRRRWRIWSAYVWLHINGGLTIIKRINKHKHLQQTCTLLIPAPLFSAANLRTFCADHCFQIQQTV